MDESRTRPSPSEPRGRRLPDVGSLLRGQTASHRFALALAILLLVVGTTLLVTELRAPGVSGVPAQVRFEVTALDGATIRDTPQQVTVADNGQAIIEVYGHLETLERTVDAQLRLTPDPAPPGNPSWSTSFRVGGDEVLAGSVPVAVGWPVPDAGRRYRFDLLDGTVSKASGILTVSPLITGQTRSWDQLTDHVSKVLAVLAQLVGLIAAVATVVDGRRSPTTPDPSKPRGATP